MRTYEAMPGEYISEAAKNLVRLAVETGETVTGTFNDIELTATPESTADSIVQFFNVESERRHQAYISSPEYKESQRKADERKRQSDLMLEGALLVAPAAMTYKDEAAWSTFKEKNSDPYGSGVVRFADRWARLMESRIANGDTLEACADTACHLADNEGITGFMYGCAVAALSAVWIHGETLRRWHNLKQQIGTEGEEANQSGGVLNPALLTVGTKGEQFPSKPTTTGDDPKQ